MNPKRLMIDGFNLGLETGTGVATYARNLTYCARDLGYGVDVLYGMKSNYKEDLLREVGFFDYVLEEPKGLDRLLTALRKTLRLQFSAQAKRVPITGRVISTNYKSRLPHFDAIWNYPELFWHAEKLFYLTRRRLRAHLKDHLPDLVHWTYPIPLVVPGTKNIYTLHDLVPLRLPYTTLDNKRVYFNLVSQLVKRGDHIVTVSETSRRDIINLLGAREDQVTNTYQAVDIPDKYANKPEEIVRREVEGTFKLKYKGYLLYFGAIEPKKNVSRLIEAYLGSGVDTPLVIVGKKAWKTEKELPLVSDDAISYLESTGSQTFRRWQVLHINYAPFPLLVSLIRGAKAVTFPSLYEGFGLPVLEAMKLGTPVLTSNNGALEEVAGDGALLVDPYDTQSIAEGLRAIDSNIDLRGDLSVRGRRRADLFSPAAYLARLGGLYGRLLGSQNQHSLGSGQTAAS